jgi:hypothetical protein
MSWYPDRYANKKACEFLPFGRKLLFWEKTAENTMGNGVKYAFLGEGFAEDGGVKWMAVE